MKYFRLYLKVCEACGTLWLRLAEEECNYCSSCARRLEAFPSPCSRRKLGRPAGRRPATKAASRGGAR